MTVQTNYYDFPQFGLPGQVTDIGNPQRVEHAQAQEVLPVARAVVFGDEITGNVSAEGYKIKLPAAGTDIVAGVTIRVVGQPGDLAGGATPYNPQDSIPFNPQDSLAPFMVLGSIWAKILTTFTGSTLPRPVYVVWQNTVSPTDVIPKGSLVGISNADTFQLKGAFFQKAGAIGDIVKVSLDVRHNIS